MKKISLVIEDEDTKRKYFELLRDSVKIPTCKNCGKLFELGFPDKEEGVQDYLICKDNFLICECSNYKRIRELYNEKKDKPIDIKDFYNVK